MQEAAFCFGTVEYCLMLVFLLREVQFYSKENTFRKKIKCSELKIKAPK